MRRLLLRSALVVVCVGAYTMLAPSSAAGQCNHCGEDPECQDGHWDNCGLGGPGHNFGGACNPGCDPGDCEAMHEESCLASLDFASATRLVDANDWAGLAKAVMTRQAGFDEDRGVIYLHSCSNDMIVGQIPLERTAAVQVAANIEARRIALLAMLELK